MNNRIIQEQVAIAFRPDRRHVIPIKITNDGDSSSRKAAPCPYKKDGSPNPIYAKWLTIRYSPMQLFYSSPPEHARLVLNQIHYDPRSWTVRDVGVCARSGNALE